MLSRRRLLRTLAALPAARTLARAFPGQDDPQFSTGVSVVNVLTIVRDHDGKIVTGLTAGDFTLEVDGHPVPIRYFSQQSDLPLVLGLLVDSSGSVRSVLQDEVQAARKFLRQVIREDRDRAFVIRFDNDVELMQDLTPSVARLEQALEDIHAAAGSPAPRFFQPSYQFPEQIPGQRRPRFPIPTPFPGGSRPPRGGRQPGPRPRSGRGNGPRGGTSLYDAVYLGADQVMRPQQDRKAMILISDGLDGGSKVSLATAIEAAQRADTLVYSIRFSEARSGARGVETLERVASETGGAYFDASGRLPLEKVFASIEEDLRNQYNLGFSPEAADAGYRRIKVKVNRPGLEVRAREGYYSGARL